MFGSGLVWFGPLHFCLFQADLVWAFLLWFVWFRMVWYGMISYVLADLFWSVWFVLVLPARVCASLTSFALVWFGLPGITWSGLSSSGLFCFALVWSVCSGSHWSVLGYSSAGCFLVIGFVSCHWLGFFRLNPALFWCGLLCSTLDWSALGFLVWFSLLRAVLFALLALG